MGAFTVKFVVSHPLQPGRRVEFEGLVDNGALFTQIPEPMLAGIGIGPSGRRAVHYADGTGAIVPVAKADISIHGVEAATMIFCGRPKSLVLLGATTLETLGFGIDPIHKQLIPVDAPMTATSAAGPATTWAGSALREAAAGGPGMSSADRLRSGNRKRLVLHRVLARTGPDSLE